IIIAVVGVVALAIFHPKFRQLLRIRFNAGVKAGSTAIEREQDEYNRLMALLPKQQEAVATVMADARIAGTNREAARRAVEQAEKDFYLGDDSGASEQTLLALAAASAEAQENVRVMAQIAEEAARAEDEAEAALDATIKALNKFKQQIERDKSKDKLAQA